MTGSKPLHGITILDLTNVLAGPFCCHQLAHLGAEVIKVEVPGRGDLARQLGADAELSAANMGISFLAQNAGKKSLTLNLKSAAGKTILKQLVARADVLVENFRPGVMDRLGLGYDTLKDSNEALIYCAISGFGADGPWKDRPAYDQIVQGASGVMSITGDADSAPLRVGYPMADTIGGLAAAMAVSAALNARPRGAFIDVSMLDAVISTMGWVVSNHLIGGVDPVPNGNENFTSAPSGAFQTGDGLLNIAANREEQWLDLVQHLNRDDLRDHPDYATRELRKNHRTALRIALEETLAEKSARDWARELNAIGVPAGPVMRVPDMLAHPQIAERGLVATFDGAEGVDRPLQILRPGFQMNGERPSVDAPPPGLGADTQAILSSLGYDDAAIHAMKEEGVI